VLRLVRDQWLRIGAAAIAASTALAALIRFGLSADGAIAAFVCIVLVVLTVTDIERRRLPNRIVLPSAVAALIARTVASGGTEWVIAGVGAALFFLVVALIYPAGLGMGDVKLALLLGFALGRSTPIALAAGLFAALVYSAAVLIRSGWSARTTSFALGPFLALGGLIALFVTTP